MILFDAAPYAWWVYALIGAGIAILMYAIGLWKP